LAPGFHVCSEDIAKFSERKSYTNKPQLLKLKLTERHMI
jgi:hypothetical protein